MLDKLASIDVNFIVLAVIAVANAVTGFLAYRTHLVAVETKKDVATVKEATNGLQEALVSSTAKASKAEGELKGRADAATAAAAAVVAAAGVAAGTAAVSGLAKHLPL